MGLYKDIISFENNVFIDIYRKLALETQNMSKLSKILMVGMDYDEININLMDLYIKSDILAQLRNEDYEINKSKYKKRKEIIKSGLDNLSNEQFTIIKSNIEEYYNYLSNGYKKIFDKYICNICETDFNYDNSNDDLNNCIYKLLKKYNQNYNNISKKIIELKETFEKKQYKIIKLSDKLELAYNLLKYKDRKISDILMTDI